MRTRFALSLAEAEAMVAAALRFARNKGLAVTAAVVDDAGIPILVCRLDEASPASILTAIEKARSAAFTGLPTFALESMIAQRPALRDFGSSGRRRRSTHPPSESKSGGNWRLWRATDRRCRDCTSGSRSVGRITLIQA